MIDIYNLTEKLNRAGLDITPDDIQYQFLDREEYLYIDSGLIYPGLNIPAKLGVYRGYSGGGIHSSLMKTQVYNLPKNRINKANKILDIFEAYFWDILKSLQAEDVEIWDSVLI